MMLNPEFTDLYQRHGPTVFRRARRFFGTDADAHEVVQDVFLSLLEDPAQFQGKSSLTTFLYRVTTNACLTRIRNEKNRSRLQREHLAPAGDTDSAGTLTPEERFMLQSAIRSMPQELAQAAVYYLVDGLTHEEIARLLDCSRRHVGDLLARIETWNHEENASC
jgi:RNA polymerase sigma-70 factor (ECF subfamily)